MNRFQILKGEKRSFDEFKELDLTCYLIGVKCYGIGRIKDTEINIEVAKPGPIPEEFQKTKGILIVWNGDNAINVRIEKVSCEEIINFGYRVFINGVVLK
jgi:hypothetical protein